MTTSLSSSWTMQMVSTPFDMNLEENTHDIFAVEVCEECFST